MFPLAQAGPVVPAVPVQTGSEVDPLLLAAVVIGSLLLLVLGIIAWGSLRMAGNRRHNPRLRNGNRPHAQRVANTHAVECPPHSGPECVPAKRINQGYEHVAVAVPRDACGCGGTTELAQHLQLVADEIVSQQHSERRQALGGNLAQVATRMQQARPPAGQ